MTKTKPVRQPTIPHWTKYGEASIETGWSYLVMVLWNSSSGEPMNPPFVGVVMQREDPQCSLPVGLLIARQGILYWSVPPLSLGRR